MFKVFAAAMMLLVALPAAQAAPVELGGAGGGGGTPVALAAAEAGAGQRVRRGHKGKKGKGPVAPSPPGPAAMGKGGKGKGGKGAATADTVCIEPPPRPGPCDPAFNPYYPDPDPRLAPGEYANECSDAPIVAECPCFCGCDTDDTLPHRALCPVRVNGVWPATAAWPTP